MLRKTYYNILDVKFELIKNLQYREMFLLPFKKDKEGDWNSTPPIRWLWANYIKMMLKHWNRYKFLEKDMNLYNSVVTWKNVPMFSYNWTEKRQQQNIWLDEFKNHILKCDCFIETDAKDLKKSFGDAIKIRDFLNEYGIKYHKKYSGKKGVHLIIPYEEFSHLPIDVYNHEISMNLGSPKKLLEKCPVPIKKLRTELDLVLLFKALNLRIKILLNAPTTDTSISDVKRVCKTAYSWDVKSGLIALPLTDEQLENFSRDIVKPKNVVKAGVHKRGLLWKNTDVPLKQRQEGITKMLKDMEIIS